MSYGATIKVPWRCPVCRNEWAATAHSRAVHGTGCPDCSRNGFNTENPAILYFVITNRGGIAIVQYGITGKIRKRLSVHRKNGFSPPEGTYFLKFEKGANALKIENMIKKRLAESGIPSVAQDNNLRDKFAGYTESFNQNLFPVKSLKELLESLDIILDEDESFEWISNNN